MEYYFGAFENPHDDLSWFEQFERVYSDSKVDWLERLESRMDRENEIRRTSAGIGTLDGCEKVHSLFIQATYR